MSVNPSTRRQEKASPAADDASAPEIREATEALRHAMLALDDATEQLQRVLALRLEHATSGSATTTPALEHAAEVFKAEVRALLGDEAPDDDAVRRATRQTLAEQAWQRRLGTLMDTADVVALLNVSRQHVNALAKDHRLIALKQDSRQRYPAWQFGVPAAAQRACLAAAHQRLVDDGDLTPWTAASWFLDAHPELDDRDPVAFLRAGGACERVLAASRRDAARAAQ